jgi:hypothetical protein
MTTEQYQIGYEDGHSDGFDEAVKQAAQPDCRTCKSYYIKDWMGSVKCCDHGDCTNGDKYQPAPAVMLWRTE